MILRYSPTGVGPYGGDYPDERPKTRGKMEDGTGCFSFPRPCPFVSCRYHLAIDSHREIDGKTRLRVLHEDPTEMDNTCALDVADGYSVLPDPPDTAGIMNPTDESLQTDLHEIGAMCGIHVERVRQTIARAQRILRQSVGDEAPPTPTASTVVRQQLALGPKTYQDLYEVCTPLGISTNAVRMAAQRDPSVTRSKTPGVRSVMLSLVGGGKANLRHSGHPGKTGRSD